MWGQPPSAVQRAQRAIHHDRREGNRAAPGSETDPSGAALQPTSRPHQKNRRPHPLRWKRRFPHSLMMTEGVKINDFQINDQNLRP
jgi:hypothetical protein